MSENEITMTQKELLVAALDGGKTEVRQGNNEVTIRVQDTEGLFQDQEILDRIKREAETREVKR